MTTIDDLIDLAPAPEVLAKSTLQLIDGEIEGRRWHQGLFGTVGECETTCCVAGHVGLEIGAHPTSWPDGEGAVNLLDVGPTPGLTHTDVSVECVHDVARKALGLSRDQADWLFEGSRTERDVRAALTCITRGEPIDPLIVAGAE